MKKYYRIFLLLVLSFMAGVSSATAKATWQSVFSIDTGLAPLDAVVSESGDRIYVLTEGGDILIYASSGKLENTIHVGMHIDFIASGPSENLLLAGSAEKKTVQTISLEFIHEIDVSEAPFMGAADAPVVIAVFMDYQCPYCVRLKPVLDEVLELNSGQVKIAYLQFPLKMHKAALSAAEAAFVAFKEGKFQELHNLMEGDFRALDDENILDKAASLGFDRETFQQKMNDPGILKRIQQDIEQGKQAGVSGIPTVFINGRKLKKRTLEGFQELIDRELNLNK